MSDFGLNVCSESCSATTDRKLTLNVNITGQSNNCNNVSKGDETLCDAGEDWIA